MDFESFYRSVHGREPFPWQCRLADLIARGVPPEAIALPTGCGKTSVVDLWIWAAICTDQPVPRRLFFVVDRRTVVDEVSAHAAGIVERCKTEGIGAAERLPVTQLLRGGASVEQAWMLSPVRPAVIATTVDQVGSRLLFRGYGVSSHAAPIHAALVGTDAWIVLDEAHLSQPFAQTLARVRTLRRADFEQYLPWWVTSMTATTAAGVPAFELDDADRAHPALARRLGASKMARLQAIKAGESLVGALVAAARMHREAGAAVVAVIANQVATARSVFDVLQRDGEAVLLTGRVRPFDRDDTVAALLPRILTESRSSERLPLYVVATQTIEVGLDADFDALVSQAAPLSALRQRFGRLDRLGSLGQTHATIVRDAGDDPVYEDATVDAWKWLTQVAQRRIVDFGVAALRRAMDGIVPPEEPVDDAPWLSEAVLATLAQTHPALPIDVSPYLHGFQRDSDVMIAWRADLVIGQEDTWPAVIDVASVQLRELMPVPVYAARAWLVGQASPVSDLVAAVAKADPARQAGKPIMRVDLNEPAVIDSRQIRAGMVLVVPSSYGGCDEHGWAPASRAAVHDWGDRDADRVRLHPALIEPTHQPALQRLLEQQTRLAVDDIVEALGLESRWRKARATRYPQGVLLDAHTRSSQDVRTQKAVALQPHQQGVGERAAKYAQDLALGAVMVDVLRQAGLIHDQGKADPRFQGVLGGSADAPLAKSALAASGLAARRLFEEAGLRPGWRHEIASLQSVAADAVLLRHLVGSHHGRGRAWLPIAPDPELAHCAGVLAWPSQFVNVQREHGYWGTAFLETLLRLADWEQSAAEQGQTWFA